MLILQGLICQSVNSAIKVPRRAFKACGFHGHHQQVPLTNGHLSAGGFAEKFNDSRHGPLLFDASGVVFRASLFDDVGGAAE